MLEELKRLQTHIGEMKDHLQKLEKENSALLKTQQEAQTRYEQDLAKKQGLIEQKQIDIVSLKQNLNTLQSEHKQLNQDSDALAERYTRLDKGCNELKTRFQEILAERNELRLVKEKLSAEQRTSDQEISELQQEREHLVNKNEMAKAKFESVIQRLATLGTDEDQNTQDIQQLIDAIEEQT